MLNCRLFWVTTLVGTLGLVACGSDEQASGDVPSAGTGGGATDAAAESAQPDATGATGGVGGTGEDAGTPEDATVNEDGGQDADASVAKPEEPRFDQVASYSTTITASGDPTDVYHPNPADLGTGSYAFPIALMMQGAKVDKQHYASFARTVASYGFVVVVPNHESMSVTGQGLYMQPSVVNDVLGHMQAEQQSHPALGGKLDLSTLVLLGHSYGGVVAMQALQGVCQFPFCIGGFNRPAELKAGALFATNMKPPFGAIPETDNTGWAIALVQGDQDQKAKLADTVETYEKIKAPPKALVTLAGVNHYGICDTNNPPGADADTGAATTDQAAAVETAARWSALFLRAHVLGDTEAASYVHQTGDASDPVATVVSEP